MPEHHDHHDHDHEHPDSMLPEEPLDAANQSLADALRASFSILKGIMLVLVVLYLFSNIRRVDSHEQALVLRLGSLLPTVHPAGLVWAFPYPIDEIVPLPTRKSNDIRVKSHTFNRRPEEEGKPLSFISRGGEGLNPGVDGALVTADHGLVHVEWKVTYKIDDVRSYVSNILSKELEAAEGLIRTFVETTGIEVASELTAEEIIRTRVDSVQVEMVRRVNDRLTAINSGLVVTRIEMADQTPPIPVRAAFDNTQRAENTKQARIRGAEQRRTKILSEAAGSAYPRMVTLLDQLDGAAAAGRPTDKLRTEAERMLEQEVEGEAGRMIKDAGAYLAKVVGRMKSDVELYRTLVPEYERAPRLLVERLWEETRQTILSHPGVTKIYRPSVSPFWLMVPLDPEQSKLEEERRLQKQDFDIRKLRPEKLVPLGPDAG